jgi:hypothetical protein
MTFPLIRFTLALALLMGTVIPGLQAAGNLRELVSPAGADSGEANLHADRDGRLHLTWCGPADRAGSRAVWLSLLEPSAQTWSSPRAIVVSPRLMENWADFPSLIRGTDGTLWAQWFERRDASVGTGYDGWVARSVDDGRTWSQPSPLGHEFVSLAPMSSGRVLAIWLESLQPPRPAGAPRSPRPTWKPGDATPASMQLKSRLLAADGSTVREWVVDPDVCSCCQTSLVALPGDETLAFYRGRTPLEIRDHCCARFGNETWSAPQPVHEDGWQTGRPRCRRSFRTTAVPPSGHRCPSTLANPWDAWRSSPSRTGHRSCSGWNRSVKGKPPAYTRDGFSGMGAFRPPSCSPTSRPREPAVSRVRRCGPRGPWCWRGPRLGLETPLRRMCACASGIQPS